ncbi:hypothetical protein K435DRAFT_840922 [Dendrothele bispora CBS 962.96]|uniref:Uncharacterized protein n=1 Tax=Dendrothele bispora (strain CBS 962.96) TaxID=1314807 RepID=A0A4S8LQK6_DENBC|nr:hypothetical protein K435DRAFT_840922 [Dendrothele bispora CBS 962.96]
MRVKYFWNYVPLPSMLKLVWDRLTFNRITTAYFIFSLIHCFIQLGLQIRAFTINADAAVSLYDLSLQANAINNSVPYFNGDKLELCTDVDEGDCTVVWDRSNQNSKQNTPSDYDLQSASISSSSKVPSSSKLPASSGQSSVSVTRAATSVTPDSTSSAAAVSASTVVAVPPPATSSSSTSELSLPTGTQNPQNRIGLPEDEEEEDDDDDESDNESDAGSDSDSEDGFDSDDEDDLDVRAVRRAIQVMTVQTLSDGQTKVTVSGPGFSNVALTRNCVWALNWPVSILENTKREDVVFISFQIWVLGMSFVALMNESIPHVVASLLTHVLATVWSGFQISHTASFRSDFNEVIVNGACGIPLLGNYWNERANAEYATLALNIAALFVSGFLSWKLFKAFGWLTFKRVGASLTINRIYKLVLVLSIVLQLSLFFMGATVGLWIDNLFNGVAAGHGHHVTFYRVTAFVAFFLLFPWIVSGWLGIRNERRVPMFVFLVSSILYLAAWSNMFFSDTFRWTYLHWVFFCIMASSSVFLTLLAFILGLVCRYNFGKGLPRYLQAQEPLPGDDFSPITNPDDIEKVAFPTEAPLPTYSAAFGKEVPPPSQMFPARMGPRFFRTSSEPFETPRNSSTVTIPSVAMTRSSSPTSDAPYLDRSNSKSSAKSFGTLASFYAYGSGESNSGHSHTHSLSRAHSRGDSSDSHGSTMQGKRWVIE